MFRKILELKAQKSLLPCLALGILLGAGWAPRLLRADIITDIEELEKESDPDKKPEKKKEKPKAEESSTGSTSGGKKSGKGKASPHPKENPDPETQTLIPEPVEGAIEASSPSPQKVPELKSSKGKTKEQRKKAPIHWQSEGTTTYSKDRSTVILQKNVTITQDDMRLQSDEAKVTFLPKNTGESGVKVAVLEGKVSITRYSSDPTERMNAKSDKATFDNQQQLVTLDGNARLWRAGDLVRGERIIYDLTTGTIKIDKAQGVVQPDRMKK